MRHALLLSLVVLLFPAPLPAQDKAPKELKILRLTPAGLDVPTARQIVIEFNRAVVPVGDMARSAEDLGITITPAVDCEWRWLNTKSLSCNLGEEEELQKATHYKIHIEPKIAAEDGAMIAEAKDYEFTTQRPRLTDGNVYEWQTPGLPRMRLSFNQPVTKSSVEAHIYFEQGKDQPVRVPLKASADEDSPEEPVMKNGEEAREAWVAVPSAEFPLNAEVSLKQEEGLVSALGDQPGIDYPAARTIYTFPEFSFRGVVCYSLEGLETFLTPGSPQKKEDLCDPMRPIMLSFSSPALRSQVKENLTISPPLGGAKQGIDPWGDNSDWSRLQDQRNEQNNDYRIYMPYGMKAAQEFTLSVPEVKLSLWQRIVTFLKGDEPQAVTKMADEFGRSLPPFTFKFATGHRNPNFEMVYRDAVLEKNIDSEVPLYVNNLEKISFDYAKMDGASSSKGSTDALTLPKVQDVQYAIPVGVRDILDGKSGAVYANLKTEPAAKNKWEDAGRLFAQVTPWQVYAKLGHFKSSVWVTDLATGEIVPDAKVSIFAGKLSELRAPEKPLASADTDERGVAELPGMDTLDPKLIYNRSWKDDDDRLFVRIDKDGDMALLPVSYDYEIQLWNVSTDLSNATSAKFGHMKAWGMTAQGIYRVGDTMQYKIYVRDQDNDRLIAPPAGKYTLEITDPAGKSMEKKEVALSGFGTIEGEYKIPESGAVGWYNFNLNALLGPKNSVSRNFSPMSVLVSDFTPAPFRVTTELNGDAFKSGDTLDIDALAALHSGGAYADAVIRSTITLVARSFTSENPKVKDYRFDSFRDEVNSEDLFQKEDKLDDKGEWKTSFKLPEKNIVNGLLVVESAVRDDRGKSIASTAQAEYQGVDRLVGMKQTEWVYTAKKPAIVKTVVVDAKGNPVSGTAMDVLIEKEVVSTAKVKGAGNAYLNDNTVEWQKAGECALTSADDGQDCAFTPDSAGTYRITASIKDTKGRAHSTTDTVWVAGSGYVQWNDGSNYALTTIPEKTDYKVGDTARYLVKNPYPGAQALVTVERYGVLDSFVQTLEGSAPIIEIPVKADYLPGFYVSVVAVSPRVDAPPPEMGQIDMGKPAFRVGYVKTIVNDPYKEMVVTAKAEQDVYRPRDKVKVTLNAKPRHEDGNKEPINLAVAVLDESVFDLIIAGKDAFDPYTGFYDLEALDVSNYSLMTRLIGRQKFEKKGANPGGDGGVDAGMRNMFKFVSYWNPAVPVDENGNAIIEFDAPDNLTGWKVLALAVTPTDRMGLGEGNFKVNRPTEIRPVMPNQVREGDSFKAGFSVMNRTDKPRTLKVTITAEGDLKESKPVTEEQTLTLEPYKRSTVYASLDAALLPLTRDAAEGKISFSATAGDESDSDGLEHSLPVLKSRTLEVGANYATTTEDKVSENIAIPKDIYTDSGDISVVLSPTVISGLDGSFKYMRDYPYTCWEQKITKALMASYYTPLKPYLDSETVWEDADKVPQAMIDAAPSYQAPNGGMTYFNGRDAYVDPYLSAYTALAFNWLKKSGYDIPSSVEDRLHKYLLSFLRNKSAPDYYSDGMTSSIRAVILAALKDTGEIKSDDVLRLREQAKTMNLFAKAHYLQAAQSFPQTMDAARETLDAILASGVESGGKFSFNDTYDDGWNRVLATPLRDNCAVLSAFMSYPDDELINDKPFKLVRMITQGRGARDHFPNTQENIFCLKALNDYAAKYESESPDMKISASYRKEPFGTAAFGSLKDSPVTLERPLKAGDEGTLGTVDLTRNGDGRLYYSTRLRYAKLDPKTPVNSGIDIRREYSIRKDGVWKIAGSPLEIKRGDLVKVDLYLSLPTARSFVAVHDPLPGGLETVNRDLATASPVDDRQAQFDEAGGSYWFKFSDWREYNFSRWSFYHKELRHDSARFYSDWLNAGNYHLSYMAQAIATGTFAAPPAKAEEMYDPDVYGLGDKGQLIVEETP
jgi:uncharacterized protein YfaS (alpha-2-macroglobulin family)